MHDKQPINVSSTRSRNRTIVKASRITRVLLAALLRRAARNRAARLEAAANGAF